MARVPRPPEDATLVPVPLGRRRARERGFNQSALLARELGRRWGLPVQEPLVRVREGADQRGARASARARQVAGAFAVPPGGTAPGRPWLVDDVHTTGATLAACARALRAAGRSAIGGGRVRPRAAGGGLAMIGVRSIAARIRPMARDGRTSSLEGSERGDRAASGQGPEHVRHRCPVRSRGAEAGGAGAHPAALGRGDHRRARAVGGAEPEDRAPADRGGHRPHQGPGPPRARERGGHVLGHRSGGPQAGAPGAPLPRPPQGPRAARHARRGGAGPPSSSRWTRGRRRRRRRAS